jgi:hypothetical protein
MTVDLRALEDELAAAVAASDRPAADRLLDDSFVLTSSLGTRLRIERQAWLANLEAIETGELSVRTLQEHVVDDVGVVVWWMDWRARWGGDDLSGPYLVTDVWWERGGSWRLRWRSWARLNAEFLVEELQR